MVAFEKIKLPKFIGICGNPKSGKTEVQKILHEKFGIISIDDGMVLRKFCVDNLGLSWEDVTTQIGKSKFTEILDRKWQNREILGVLGEKLEEMFGENIMPFIAMKNLNDDENYSFGSVRKNQGWLYKKNGGIVIGVRNDTVVSSDYKFDKFNEDCIDFWIDNNFQKLGFDKATGLELLSDSVVNTFMERYIIE